MKPAPFSYHRPGSLSEALGLLSDLGADAKPLAGGQSLGPMLNMRLARPAHIVDLNDLLELDYVRRTGDGLEIGGMTRHHRLASAPEVRRTLPLLAEAASTIGHYAIRQRGTLGGSIVHADPAAQLPLVAVVLEAEAVIRSRAGERVAVVADFLQSIMTVDLADGELVTALRFPVPPTGTGWGFELFSRRRGDFAIASAAALIELAPSGAIAALRIAIGGAGAVPVRLDEIEHSAVGEFPDGMWCATVARCIAEAANPEEDPQIPVPFRRELLQTLAERALTAAHSRAAVA